MKCPKHLVNHLLSMKKKIRLIVQHHIRRRQFLKIQKHLHLFIVHQHQYRAHLYHFQIHQRQLRINFYQSLTVNVIIINLNNQPITGDFSSLLCISHGSLKSFPKKNVHFILSD
jgi:hypothetical protein